MFLVFLTNDGHKRFERCFANFFDAQQFFISQFFADICSYNQKNRGDARDTLQKHAQI